jgi:hypothetical protein
MPAGRPKRDIRLSNQLSTCLSDEESQAVKIICDYRCMAPSQYARAWIRQGIAADSQILVAVAAASAAKS